MRGKGKEVERDNGGKQICSSERERERERGYERRATKGELERENKQDKY